VRVKAKGFIKPLALGGSKGFEFVRGGERGRRERAEEWVGGGRGRVYEAYEVKNKRQKLRCLLLRRKKKNIFYLFMK